ncbi:cupin domain-containing protein [Oryzicola mucosus]|uniref:Cupin domain-containing protein n=1 Tax=Oryzicola mucosus TaxID=2767425 RepID=A0A8J6TYG8_9HYPH|nr:cupin domain-containing protein [Oryzicola mucosus]MBD0414684.1 cupin domain-containing protein [Oryzicola mucosus]
MDASSKPTCKVVRRADTYGGKQGLTYTKGISTQSVGSTGICMHVVTIPPGGRAKAHLHEAHETAVYILSGVSRTWFGDRLEQFTDMVAGEMMYIPAGVPHVPENIGSEPCTAVIARTDPNEQESVVLLPELDAVLPAAN